MASERLGCSPECVAQLGNASSQEARVVSCGTARMALVTCCGTRSCSSLAASSLWNLVMCWLASSSSFFSRATLVVVRGEGELVS